MANFPDSIYSPRTVENRPGVSYDATKTKRFYAEDLNGANAEIVAIEETLGENPEGAYGTVVERLDAIEDALPKFKTGAITRDVSLASGNVGYTGLGFQPKLIIFFALGLNGTTDKVGFGVFDGSNQGEIHLQSGPAWYKNNDRVFNFYFYTSSSNYLVGTAVSLDSDGFTINWQKNGSPTGTALIQYIAFG